MVCYTRLNDLKMEAASKDEPGPAAAFVPTVPTMAVAVEEGSLEDVPVPGSLSWFFSTSLVFGGSETLQFTSLATLQNV